MSAIWNITFSFLTNPFLVLAIVFGVFSVFMEFRKKGAEYKFVLQLIFLVGSLLIWWFLFPYSRIDLFSYLLFTFFITLSIIVNAEKKAIKIFLAFLVVSLVASSIIGIILYPIINELNPQVPLTLLLLDLEVPQFLYYIFPIGITSFLLGFCLIHLLDKFFQEIQPRKIQLNSLPKTIFVYYQIIPLSLLPFFLAQQLSRTDLLGWFTLTMSSLFGSYSLFYLYSFCLSLLGNRIFKTRYLWVASIFTLISVVSTLYLAFQYIIWNVDYGSWGLGFVLVPLVSYVSGTVARRSIESLS